jgi:osmoprotectant transport system substrate-binding protein
VKGSRTLIAGVVAAVAVLVAAVVAFAGHSSTHRARTVVATTARAKPGAGKPAIVLGDKNFPEEYILGDLYQQALQAQGYTVTLKSNIGSTEVTWAALKSGQISGYPEYDGTLLSAIAGISSNPSSAAAAATETTQWAAKHGYLFTKPTPFTDSDAIAVLKSYAQAHKLSTIADLKKLGKSVVLGGAPEFQTRFPDGLLGLNRTYGDHPTFDPVNIGSFYSLLDKHTVDAGVVFTTDPQLKSGKYVVLKDTKFIFGFQNVGLVVKKSVAAAEGPTFVATVNRVSALLTQNAIIALNAAVELDQQSPATVAHAFLKANHML